MRSAVSCALLVSALGAAPRQDPPARRQTIHHFQIASEDPAAWGRILTSVGLQPASPSSCTSRACVVVVTEGAAPADPKRLIDLVQQGSVLILEGDSQLARSFGISPEDARAVPVRSIVDTHNPQAGIVWERAVDIAPYKLPRDSMVFARERWRGVPVAAGFRHGFGSVLWIAVPPGTNGYERFPYLPQALATLGVEPGVSSRDLWAFFDSSYRLRVDADYFAERWREAGIAALHVAAWHYFEPDNVRDDYLRRLIEACHKRGVLIYAWIEFPHVSEKFWSDHPEWREQTALLQDGHLDWRRLMNLRNPDCARAVQEGLARLVDRFDWDGINLAELYFESLEGHSNAARFTPMNPDVRRDFQQLHGFDPIRLFQGPPDPAGLRQFLDYRAEAARLLQEHWIGEIERIRRRKPHLDLVLTHVDDRYDPKMRDLIGADAARLLPLLNRHDFTFLVEDPATLWNLGPDRYPEIAAKYAPITPRPGKLGIDINIVSRYQDVYPTKQQTGAELFQLVHMAAGAFPRVALYFESSILTPDLPLLPASAAVVEQLEIAGQKTAVKSPRQTGVAWNGPALVNGSPWPYQSGGFVWLPPGAWSIERAPAAPPLRMHDFAGELRSLHLAGNQLEIAYQSATRAFAFFDQPMSDSAEVDGHAAKLQSVDVGGSWRVTLPKGQHVVSLRRRP